MGILTNRLKLFLPGGGSSQTISPPDVADIDKLNENFRALDEAAGFQIVTSTTRPPTPFSGQPIAETDTGNMLLQTPGGYRAIGIARVANKDARDALLTAAVQGDVCYRRDLGYEEWYYGAYNATTNPAGALAAGWYPAPGTIVFQAAAASTSDRPSAQTFQVGANAYMPWPADKLGGALIQANTERIAPKVFGHYRVEISTTWAGSAAGERAFSVLKNAASVPGGGRTLPATINSGGNDHLSALLEITDEADYLSFPMRQTSGALLAAKADITITYNRPRKV